MSNHKISVITPTARGEEGLKLIRKALTQQTFQDFEWLIQLKTPVKKGNVWSLNHDYNLLFKKVKSPLIVTWQDYTYAKPDTLERFYSHFQDEPKTLVTAVGNKYKDDSWVVMTWKDPRERSDLGTYYQCYFTDVEWNLASIPKQAVYDVGGFMEDLDQMFGLDGYCVNERIAEIGGYNFKIDQSIKSYSIKHGRPKGWNEKNWLKNNRYEAIKLRLKSDGKWPVAPYLAQR